MPWTVSDAKKHKKGLTPKQAASWAKIANGVLRDCQKSGGSDCEGRAIRVANSKFEEGVMSEETFDWKAHDEHFGVTEDRKKPGGSNVGKYKKGPFCGPSGGAPKGSYPVNTKKKAIAAIGYRRHAPNPSGIKACVCRHWPGLDACKKGKKKEKQSMDKETYKISKGALHFMDRDCFAKVNVTDDGKDHMDMVAYSGGIIKDHWYWNNLAIDLDGMEFPNPKYPVLENHETSRKIGFSGKPTIDGALRINNVEFVETPESLEFRSLSKKGFPYEASIYAKPTVVERVSEGAKVEVNGFSLRGPGTVWRKCIYKEASVCVHGFDSNTKATAFGTEEIEITLQELNAKSDQTNKSIGKEVGKMNFEEFKEEHPDLLTEITENIRTEVTDELTTQFDQEKKDLEKTLKAKFTQEREGLEGKVQGLEEKVLKSEKSEAIRREKELKLEAKVLWVNKLAESDIPDRLYEKVMGQISHDSFVKDDVLDEEAFGKAIDAEIKDWEDKGMTSSVLGVGFPVKDTEGTEAKKLKLETEEDDKLAEDLFQLSGGDRTKKGGE